MLMAYSTCNQFWRTLPNLIMDEHKVEDVETKGEDHVYDECCHICMARPLAPEKPKKPASWTDQRLDMLERGSSGDDFEDWMVEIHKFDRGHNSRVIHDRNLMG